jgi:hypothetical protein
MAREHFWQMDCSCLEQGADLECSHGLGENAREQIEFLPAALFSPKSLVFGETSRPKAAKKTRDLANSNKRCL